MSNPLTYAMLAELLAALEADGALPGTDQHLRIQELLRQLPPDAKPEDLKTWLAPVLCKNKDEQERFYELFERSWKHVQEIGVLRETTEIPNNTPAQLARKDRRWNILARIAIGILALLGGWLIWQKLQQPPEPRLTRDEMRLTTGDTGRYRIDTLAEESGLKTFSTLCLPADSACVLVQIDSPAFMIRVRGLRAGADSVCLKVESAQGELRLHTLIISVAEPDTTAPPDSDNPTPPDTALYAERPLPYPIDQTRLLPPQPTQIQQALLDYEWPIKTAGFLLTGFLCWFLAQWIERKRRKLIAEHQPNSKPPYTWDIHLDDAPDLAFSERFYAVLHQLRQRELDEARRLDMPKTVKATIAKAGMPQIRYSQRTRPAEYLLLLDRQGARNHRAQLFNLLYKTFSSQEVIIERFYYDGDPRLCHNEKHAAGITLRELQYQYPQARLLILGDGFGMLNPQSGRLAKWTQLFAGWTDRALLSPQPPGEWGRRERALQEQFLVLPAALSGLQAAIQHFDDLDGQAPDITPRQFPDANWGPIQLQAGGLIATLEYYFPPTSTSNFELQTSNLSSSSPATSNFELQTSNLTTWVAACAVYPELHWDLTLYIGQLLSSPENNLLTLENIAQLCRLPWFVTGEMPLEARKTLLGWLEEKHPETLQHVRAGLHRLLLHNPPPRDSAAHDDFAMNMALNEWLFTKDKRRRQELEQQIAARLAAGQQADFTVVKVLDRPRSPLDFVVPDAWKKYVYTKGSRLLGARAWVWLLPVWLVLSGLILSWAPAVLECSGESADYQEQPYCLETGEELVQFWEMMALDTLAKGDTLVADSLIKRIILTNWENWKLSGGELRNTFLTKRMRPGGDTSVSFTGSLREVPFGEVRAQYNMLNPTRGDAVLPDDASKWIDSVACLQNLAVGYFNAGIRQRETYSVTIGKQLFSWNCAACHNKNMRENMTGPALGNVESRWAAYPRQDLYKMIRNSQQLIAAGHPMAVENWKKYQPAMMNSFPGLTDEQIEQLLAYINWNFINEGTTENSPLPDPESIITPCDYFSRAQQLNGMLPDTLQLWFVREAAKTCPGYELGPPPDIDPNNPPPPPPSPPDVVLRGRILDATTKAPLPADLTSKIVITAKGLPNGKMVNRSEFEITVPGDWGSAVVVTVEAPGYQSLTLTEQTKNLKRTLQFLLQPLEIGVDEARAIRLQQEGETLLKEARFQNAISKFQEALRLTPNRKEELTTLINQAQQGLAEQQRQQQIQAENKDRDGDGVPDNQDKCPDEPGPASNGGCPVAVFKEPDFNMLPIPGGAFDMGCNRKTDGNCSKDALPEHRVTLNTFYLSKYEVTQAQWEAVMGSNPSYFKNCDNCPVEQVSWYDVQDFITKLNELTGKKYRLPTEAEWEYAARGGEKSRYYRYSGSNNLDAVAWYAGNSGGRSHPVGSKEPNELGLYDMTGNVWEWCSDWYDQSYYSKSLKINPPGPASGSRKVLRGCSWDIEAGYCGVAFRSSIPPRQTYNYWGFRLAMDGETK